MAAVGYRPDAPSDGFGNIVNPLIAAVLVAGLPLTWTPPPWRRRAATVVQSRSALSAWHEPTGPRNPACKEAAS